MFPYEMFRTPITIMPVTDTITLDNPLRTQDSVTVRAISDRVLSDAAKTPPNGMPLVAAVIIGGVMVYALFK